LLKDKTFAQYLSYGSTDPLRKGMIQEAYGFENINFVPNLNTYAAAGDYLQGFINHQNAMLVATSPIMPAPAVRQLLVSYDVVTDPATGITFEYRLWGAPSTDTTNEIIECNFGAAPGVQTSLYRITSQ
jgi:hypothetical protein